MCEQLGMPFEGFVILSQQRSGTHFLNSLLKSHPVVQSFGEVIHSRPGRNSYFDFLGHAAANDPAIVRPSEAHRAWAAYFRHLTQGLAGVIPGAIVMYNQLPLLPQNLADRIVHSTRVVHLIRRNVLRTHVSDLINRARLKPAHSTEESLLKTVELKTDTLVEDLLQRQRVISMHREKLQGRSHIEITYEDSVADPDQQAARVFRFLRLDPVPVSTMLKPTNPYPLSSIITNFQDVRNVLAATSLSWMSED